MMKISTISESEMHEAGVASLSNRPTSPYVYGGEGLTPSELKERFDRLPRLVASRLNLLLRAVGESPELPECTGGSLLEMLPSGMFPTERPEHTLANLLAELLDGTASGYLTVGARSLADALDAKEEASRIALGGVGTHLTPESDTEYRLGEVTSLTVSLPDEPTERYTAVLVFDTLPKNGDSEITLPASLTLSGDDVIEGELLPFGGRHYTVMIWYDGGYQGIVRSVPRGVGR